MSPHISVVIPTYNRSALAAQAIDSVLAQSYGDFEIVLVDDGSSDDTRQVIGAYNDPRVRYFFQENAGLGAARNAGIARAQGQYVAFLDSDDLFLPHCLERHIDSFQREQDAGFVAGGYMFLDEGGQAYAARRPWRHLPQVDTLAALRALPIVPSGVVVRRSWLEGVGGVSNMRRSEDYDLWIRLIYGGCNMAWTPDLVCGYRIHSGQMVNDGRSQKESALVTLDHFFAQPDLPKMLSQQRDQVYAVAYLSGAFREYGAGQVNDARASLDRAIQLDPSLLDGQVSQVANALVGWAADPVTGDPTDYVLRVLAHLPPAAAGLQEGAGRLVRVAASRAALDAIGVDNLDLARTYLQRAQVAGYPWQEQPGLMVALVVDAVRGAEFHEQERDLARFFACLPNPVAETKSWHKKAMARLYMARSFACLGREHRREARRWAWQGVRHDPTWLANGGVISTLVKPARPGSLTS